MENIALIESFSEFKDDKFIDRVTLMAILEDVFRNALKKKFGSDDNYDIIINPDKGDLEIWRNRVIVEDGELEDPNMEITISEALKIDDDFEVGEDLTDEVPLEHFGRRTILNLRQTLSSKILELEKDNLYNLYKDKVGEIVSGEVYQVWKKELLLLDDDHNELILPKTEQIPS